MSERIKTPYILNPNLSASSTKVMSSVTQSRVKRIVDSGTVSGERRAHGGIFDLAKVFLTYESMTNKKLQKLCYYSQAWHLALEDTPLIDGCEFQAWVHGPVCKELYQHYRGFGFDNIPLCTDNISSINEEIREFAKDVYEVYGQFTGNELEKMTHRELPWIKARGDLEPWMACNNVISEDDMKQYFRSI